MKHAEHKNGAKFHIVNFKGEEEMLFQLPEESQTGAVATEDRLYHCRDVALKPFVHVCVCVCVCAKCERANVTAVCLLH